MMPFWLFGELVADRGRWRMRVLMSGGSGLVGKAVSRALQADGCEVWNLSRRPSASGNVITWDVPNQKLDASRLEGMDAVIHLAGEGIADKRWTPEVKQRIRDSRVLGTRLLVSAVTQWDRRPKVFISASAIGYYGDRGAERLNEESPPGSGFLAETCAAWERETEPLDQAGIRRVNLRIGVVLSSEGGALAQMLTPFRLGFGGVVGPGTQMMSWITREDLVRVIQFCLREESARGPVNATAPRPASNRDFTKALGRVLRRPTILPLPAFAARLALGEMADGLLLASADVHPDALERLGFSFGQVEIESALRSVLH